MQAQILTLCGATLLATASSILLAADVAVETFWGGAERWGLWAALTLLLVLAVLWGLYRIVTFVLTTLVELIQANQKCLTKVADAIKNAPCGINWDSDGDEVKEAVGKAMESVLRRQRRAEKNADKE